MFLATGWPSDRSSRDNIYTRSKSRAVKEKFHTWKPRYCGVGFCHSTIIDVSQFVAITELPFQSKSKPQ